MYFLQDVFRSLQMLQPSVVSCVPIDFSLSSCLVYYEMAHLCLFNRFGVSPSTCSCEYPYEGDRCQDVVICPPDRCVHGTCTVNDGSASLYSILNLVALWCYTRRYKFFAICQDIALLTLCDLDKYVPLQVGRSCGTVNAISARATSTMRSLGSATRSSALMA